VSQILHADLDAFYASVEQLDNPDLRGKPVLVGGSPAGRGVVATASYEARVFGVHSAMPMRSAVRLCPDGIVVRPRFDRYRYFSDKVREIFKRFTPLVEPLSLDEAYLDITTLVEEGRSPLALALDLKRLVNEETGLTISVGSGSSKSVAKIASDLQKPDGLVVVESGNEAGFLAPLAVGNLWGIGPKTAERLRQGGIETIGQLAQQPEDWFKRQFGKRAKSVRDKSQGVDQDPVRTQRETKSVSSENTFSGDLADRTLLKAQLEQLAFQVAGRLVRHGMTGRTITVKVRLADFTTFTRQTTLSTATDSAAVIQGTAWRLFSRELTPGRSFRLLGVGVSGFMDPEKPLEYQLPLLEDWPTVA